MSATPVSSDTRLEIKRTFKAPRQKVFEAMTQAELMSQWFSPSKDMSCEAHSDPRKGGDYRIKMTSADGDVYTAYGTYIDFDPFSHISYTWSWEENDTKDTVVTIDLTEADGTTEMSFVHDRFADVETRNKHDEGWAGCLNRLQDFLGETT